MCKLCGPLPLLLTSLLHDGCGVFYDQTRRLRSRADFRLWRGPPVPEVVVEADGGCGAIRCIHKRGVFVAPIREESDEQRILLGDIYRKRSR